MLHETIKLYEGRDDVTLTTYVFQHSQEFLGGRKRPAVLICPGGGYLVCSDGEGEPVAIAFNRMGYNAYVLRYSVYSEPNAGPPPAFEEGGEPGFHPPMVGEPKERCIFPNPMLDIKAAMEKIAENEDRWLTDSKQIALCGFSAGAHNVGIYSAYRGRMNMPRPVGTILGYPVADMRDNETSMDTGEYDAICMAMFGTARPDEMTLDKASITKQITKDAPPMFIWNTSEDAMVMPKNSLHIAEALSKNGVPFELHTFESGPHGLSTADESSAMAADMARPDVAVWLTLADTWLKKRMKVF